MTEPYYADDAVTLYHGDCIEVLREMPDASVDAVCTDPPYGLEFMGREWDSFGREGAASKATAGIMGGGHSATNGRPSFLGGLNPRCLACGRSQRGGSPCSCESPRFTDERGPRLRAFQQWCEAWAVECLRVLKPGGHLLAFGGTRTVHRLTCAVEDAGFEIRDGIDWIYASGFPKSLDVSKAIDKRRDDGTAVARVAAWLADQADAAGVTRAAVDTHMGTSDMAGWWLSRLPHRAQVPQWEQWLRLRDLIDFGGEMDAEVWRLNGRKGQPGEAWGQREVIGTGYRVRRESDVQIVGLSDGEYPVTAPATDDAARWSGWGTALKPAREPIVVARKPLAGTVAANVLAYGTGALNIDVCRVAAGQDYRDKCASVVGLDSNRNGDAYGEWTGVREDSAHAAGRWPSNVVFSHAPDCNGACVLGCPVAELDRQSGATRDGVAVHRNRPGGTYRAPSAYGDYGNSARADIGYGGEGGASRFFPVFRYEAKAPTLERPRADGIAHPTVKPLDLMRWLVRLVTPPGGIVLEPFAGSGTTAEACVVEGFRCIAIEREADYLPLIVRRLSKPLQAVLPIGAMS